VKVQYVTDKKSYVYHIIKSRQVSNNLRGMCLLV